MLTNDLQTFYVAASRHLDILVEYMLIGFRLGLALGIPLGVVFHGWWARR